MLASERPQFLDLAMSLDSEEVGSPDPPLVVESGHRVQKSHQARLEQGIRVLQRGISDSKGIGELIPELA